MRLIFTSSAFFICLIVNAQNRIADSLPSVPSWLVSSCQPPVERPVSTKDEQIRIRCSVTKVSIEPLLVIDGIPVESGELQKLNPNDIASINILKYDKSNQIFCHTSRRDVILVTTKTARLKKIIIKDFITGDKIPSATVYLISNSDTIRAVANEEGIFETDKLKTTVQYQVTVSSAGYKSFTTTIKGKEQQILLERDIKENTNVVVIAYPTIRCGCCSNGSCRRIARSETKRANITASREVAAPFIYPNPVQRNNIVYLGFDNDKEEIMQLSIVGLNGSTVLLQSEKIRKGYNRLSVTADAKWSAGIYNIQLRNEKGTLVRQEKLVVQ